MKKFLAILVLGLLWCNIRIAGEREPGNDQKCFEFFERKNIFKKKFLPEIKKKKGAFVTYVGCNKSYDSWGWWSSLQSDIDVAHSIAHQGCVQKNFCN